MRINFKTISRTTNDETFVLMDKILMEIDKPGYRIFAQTQTMLIFRYNVWRFASRSEVFRRVDGGVFNLDSKNKTITLSYYVSPFLELIGALIAAFYGITEDYHFFIFSIFIAITFVIRMIRVRQNAQQMMDDILA